MGTTTIEFDYKKLRLAQDLQKKTLEQIGLKLLQIGDNGIYEMPSEEQTAAYLNELAANQLIKHYRLQGHHEEVFLFINEEVLNDLHVVEMESLKATKVIKVQCYDQPVISSDEVPFEISNVEGLYRIPSTTFNSGTCVYFLCRDSKVVYVGQASNVHTRLLAHVEDKKFDSVYYIRVSANRLNQVEKSLIAYLKPEYNKTSLSLSTKGESIAEGILQNHELKLKKF